MYCPECGAEFREGFYRCVDCEVDLVTEAPPPVSGVEDPDQELVTAFRSGNPAMTSLAESILQDQEISYWVKGDGLQDLFGAGRLGGFNPIVGPAEVQVALKDLKAAQEVLNPLVDQDLALDDGDEVLFGDEDENEDEDSDGDVDGEGP